MRSTLCKHHLRCPCGCLVAASAGSTSRGEAPACLLLLLRLLCQPAEIKHVCSSCGSSSFLPASLLSPGLPWVQRTESERAVSSVRLPGQPPAYTGTIVLRAELNCTVSVLGRMDKTCEMKYKVVDSPLGKLEISGCEQGLHGIKLHGGKTPDTEPAEAAAPAEQLRDPGAMLEPLLQCAAWLDTYFREPTVLEGLPVPALHHPVFQKVFLVWQRCCALSSYHQKQDMRVPSPNAPLLPVCRHGGPPTPGRLRSVLSPRLAALRTSHKWAQTAFIF
ncbi:methylated-DNA--protein-cysteine methyltransferase isoform X2 [Bubalus kerabau]|uniref:methylated-DNA--protein-cysteine methyltransferase isoform X2 n=1 Tax=Bubalus carabanensis TaxID=3119969 RepID=UPI00244E672E|nr:methylated-DNA--protein-cysteine methyltransferase isoform X2 [Bubalus carabanensis]